MGERLFQASMAGGEVSPSMYGRVDISKYSTALRKCRNFVVHRTGGVSNRAGFAYLGDVADPDVSPTLIPFRFNASSDQVCVLEFGDNTMRVWYQGGLVEDDDGTVLVVDTDYTAAEMAEAGHAQSGDVIYFAHADHPPFKLERNDWTDWDFSSLDFTPDFELPDTDVTTYTLTKVRTPDAVLTLSAAAETVTLTLSDEDVLFSEDDPGRIIVLFEEVQVVILSVDDDLASATGVVLGEATQTVYDVGNWVVWEYEENTTNVWDAELSGDGDDYLETITYKVTAVSADTGEESLPSDEFSLTGPTEDDWPVGTKIILTGPGESDDVAYYRIYKELNGLYGYIGLSADGTFEDDNIAADVSDGPPEATNPFEDEDDYPSKVAFHQQRLCWANSNNSPNGVWMSRTGFFENMTTSLPTKDDDAISFTLGSGEINAVQGLISVNDLLILTQGSENVCNGGSTGSALTPSSITVKPQSYWGAGDLPPLVSGNTALFVQGLGSAVRDLGYQYSVDGFTGSDRTILARHFLEGSSIVSWAYAQTPDSTFWMVRDDGALLSLTYFKEQDVGAWALHTTDGEFEQVVVVEGDDRHEVYVVVKRTIDGDTKRYVERMASRQVLDNDDAAFLDSYQIFDGTDSGDTTSELTGLDHLEGKTIGIYADGNVLDDATVTDGTVSLDRAYTRVVAGLRYDEDSEIETLDIDLGMVQGLGSVQARNVTVSAVTLRLQNSREFYAGPDEDTLTLTKVTNTTYDAAPDLYTGDKKLTISSAWDSNGRVVVRPAGPVPLTILAVAPDITVGG